MATQIFQSKLSRSAYPVVPIAECGEYLLGNWQGLDPIFAGRLASAGKDLGDVPLSETVRSTDLQRIYYNEYIQYKKTKILGPHGIKLAAVPGTSWHEIRLAVDVKSSHRLYHASNAELSKYGLCKPLVSKGEYWHLQPIETFKLGSKCKTYLAPVDLAPALVSKFGFSEVTLIYIWEYEFGSEFAAKLLAGQKDFSDSTIEYFEKYGHWKELEAKINIY